MRLRLSKKGFGYALLGVLAYLIFLLAGAPASLLATHVLPNTPVHQQLQMGQPSGTLWQGQMTDVSYRHLELGRVRWQLGVIPMLWGQLDARLRFSSDSNKGRGNLVVGLGGAAEAENLFLSLPAEQIVPFIPLLHRFRINAGGEVQGNLKSARVEPGSRLNAKGRVVWRDARLLVPYNMDLGNYVATLEPDGSGSQIKVHDQGGPVMLRATVAVQGNGAFEMSARLKARDESQQHITSALRALGRPDGQGWVHVAQKGVIPNWRK